MELFRTMGWVEACVGVRKGSCDLTTRYIKVGEGDGRARVA